MSQDFKIGRSFLDFAANASDAVALRDDFSSVTYEQLAAFTANFAKNLRQRGVDRTATVGVVTSDLLVMVSSMLATSLLGCRWTMAGPLKSMRDSAGITHLLDDSANQNDMLPGAIVLDASWAEPPATPDARPFEGPKSGEDIWIITHTSGTTGTPKLVALSHQCVSLRCQASANYFGNGLRLTGLFPIGAPPLFLRYLSGLLNGAEIVHSAKPECWQRYGVGYLFGSVAQIETVTLGKIITPKLPCVQLSGATPSDSLLRHLLASFEEVAMGYGSTESNQSLQGKYSVDQVGNLIKRTVLNHRVEVQCVDGEGNLVPAGESGVVRIRNPYLALGYLNNKRLTDQVFRDGWFFPGDLGRWEEDGNFTVVGRMNEQFNIGGSNISAALLDHSMRSVDGVEDAISFMHPREGMPDRLTAFISSVPGAPQDSILSDIRIVLLRLGRTEFVPEKFLFAKTLPRTPTGKADRNACIRLIQKRKQDRRARE